MIVIYGFISTAAWRLYSFCDKKQHKLIRRNLVKKATQQVFWQDFFEHQPIQNFNDGFIEDDEDL